MGIRNCLHALAMTSAIAACMVLGSVNSLASAEDHPITTETIFPVAADQTEPLAYAGCIYKAIGMGHTFMVTTTDGNVIIDTSSAGNLFDPSVKGNAPHHRELLGRVSQAPIRYIILTHAHGDHRGGIDLWKQHGTEIIAHRNYMEFRHYTRRIANFVAQRGAKQFGIEAKPQPDYGNYGAEIEPTIEFDETYHFKVGELSFELMHTPGETPDALSVWIPELEALFCGDLVFRGFPNIATLRGERPRWALDYVASLNKVIALGPELLLPSHGEVRVGREAIERELIQLRDAVLYVHDATVRGMNQGKDVYTLMREIRLPADLAVEEPYGKVSWSVRGIYEGYAGWFDGNPTSMYDTPPSAVYPELVALAGGPDAVAARAQALVDSGDTVPGLHLADVALAAAPDNETALRARLAALTVLEQRCTNSNERGWLEHGIATTRDRLSALR